MHKIAAAEHSGTAHIPAGTGSVGSRQIQPQFEPQAGSINIKQTGKTKERVSPQRYSISTVVYITAVSSGIIDT
jgi:hypothetical protein